MKCYRVSHRHDNSLFLVIWDKLPKTSHFQRMSWSLLGEQTGMGLTYSKTTTVCSGRRGVIKRYDYTLRRVRIAACPEPRGLMGNYNVRKSG